MIDNTARATSGGARREAIARLGGRYDVRVLEPSPPTVDEPPWFADDPVAGGDIVPVDRPGTCSWYQLCTERGDEDLSGWATARWLGPWAPLEHIGDNFAGTRAALHAVAEHVLAPARHAANGRIGLRFTRAGFGTPFFGRDRQLRIDAGRLVVEDAQHGTSHTSFETLREAATFADVVLGEHPNVYKPTTASDPDAPLPIDETAARALGDWFGLCASVLEQLRAESTDASRVQLWPEHFDIAVDLGDDAAAARANYGGSPGDESHPEPYLYVGPWSARQGAFWNEPFGASLDYAALLSSPDQHLAALTFLRRGRELLRASAD